MSLNKLHEVALGLIPGIGGHLSKVLVSYCGSAERVFTTPKGKLKKIPGIGENLATTIISNRSIVEKAKVQVEMAEKHKAKILFYTDKDYPDRLRHIHDAPSILYYKGNASLNTPKIAAIVGTRQATGYGKEIVDKLVEGLSKHNALVLSGLAYGIDIASHKAALHQKLPTVGVMASGLDIIYPGVHKETAKRMVESGGLLTEYGFGTQPDPAKFPARNRIIAGLCDVLIVVEAAKKGGALITAEMANDYNREVFAVPGGLGEKYSEGCNKLIKKHKAHIFTDFYDLEFLMDWIHQEGKDQKKTTFTSPIQIDGLENDEKTVVTVMSGSEGILIDEISWKSSIPLSKLASILLSLEFKGLLISLPGKKYKLAL